MSASTDRVLDEAERVFLEKGFAGARLREIASALGMRPASLYHHAPGGKAELWERVLDRALERHRVALTDAAEAGGPLRETLGAMARWLLSQPAVNVASVAVGDVRAGAPEAARALSERLYGALMVPVAEAFRRAEASGEIGGAAPDLLAGMFVAAIQDLVPAAHAGTLPRPPEALADAIIGVMLDGVRRSGT